MSPITHLVFFLINGAFVAGMAGYNANKRNWVIACAVAWCALFDLICAAQIVFSGPP